MSSASAKINAEKLATQKAQAKKAADTKAALHKDIEYLTGRSIDPTLKKEVRDIFENISYPTLYKKSLLPKNHPDHEPLFK